MTNNVKNEDGFNFAIEAFACGRSSGMGSKAVALLIQRATDNGVAFDDLDQCQSDFYAGFMSGMFGWTGKAARAWLADKSIKKRVEKGEVATPFQRGYASARMQWSRAREQAGLAKARKGRVAKTPVATEPDAGNTVDAISLADVAIMVPSSADLATVIGIVANFDSAILKLRNANAKSLTGDLGAKLREVCDAFHNGVLACQSFEANGRDVTAPVKPVKARKPAKVAIAA